MKANAVKETLMKAVFGIAAGVSVLLSGDVSCSV